MSAASIAVALNTNPIEYSTEMDIEGKHVLNMDAGSGVKVMIGGLACFGAGVNAGAFCHSFLGSCLSLTDDCGDCGLAEFV